MLLLLNEKPRIDYWLLVIGDLLFLSRRNLEDIIDGTLCHEFAISR